MDQPKNTSKFRFKWLVVSLLSIIALLLIYYTVMSILGINSEVARINEKYSVSLKEEEDIKARLYHDSLFIEINKERALYKSKLELAKTDSIGLTINILDSNACLELNGVVIHKTRITKYKLSRAFNGLDITSFANLFSEPFEVAADISTIKKEPIMVKMAPKDTSEYVPDVTPDTSSAEPVNYILEMDNGIRLFVLQSEKDSTASLNSQFYFDLRDRLKTVKNEIKSISRFKVPNYQFYIKIWIPKSDAKIIYRALPRKGLVVIYI